MRSLFKVIWSILVSLRQRMSGDACFMNSCKSPREITERMPLMFQEYNVNGVCEGKDGKRDSLLAFGVLMPKKSKVGCFWVLGWEGGGEGVVVVVVVEGGFGKDEMVSDGGGG